MSVSLLLLLLESRLLSSEDAGTAGDRVKRWSVAQNIPAVPPSCCISFVSDHLSWWLCNGRKIFDKSCISSGTA